MLTDLSWLEQGRPFPPTCERERLDTYARNEKLFFSRHAEAWKESFDRLAFLYRKRSKDVRTVFNYHQLLSKKTADFVCSEPPDLELEVSGDELGFLLEQQQFFAKLYEAVIDVSRFGNGLLKITGNRISVISPLNWFPIAALGDLKQITHHVIAYTFAPDEKGKPTQLYAEIHTPGRVETRIYGFDSRDGAVGRIGSLMAVPKIEASALPGLAVFPLSNVTHSGSIYGIDDYAIINSLVAQIMWRLHCADSIMDKHSEPSVAGPRSALEQDERTGIWLFKAGNYFARDNVNDPEVSYITWDGSLDANFREIDLLLEQLYILSEMGAAFTEGSQAGAASSGTALKLKLVSPRIKAQRLVGINNATVRQAIIALAAVNGLRIDSSALTLVWRDGLPDDPVEDANRRSVETGGKQVKSLFSAIKERGLSDKAVEEELEQIRLEAAASSANMLGVVDPFEGADDDETQ